MIFSAKPTTLLIQASYHRVKDAEIFQTPPYKAMFDDRTALHGLTEWHEGRLQAGACVASTSRFF